MKRKRDACQKEMLISPRDGTVHKHVSVDLFFFFFFACSMGKREREKRPQRDTSCVIVILQILVHEFVVTCMASIDVID